MSVQIKVLGLKRTQKFLKKKEKATQKQSKLGLTNAAIFTQGEVKSSIAGRRNEPTSVDTGRLLNSVDFNVSLSEAEIFSPLGYAKFIEFGTSKFTGRKHFQNTKNRNKRKITKIIQKAINII